jgi:hypothetical protein
MPKLKQTKEAIVKKAEELGAKYEAEYRGCARSTFMAIVDALRWGGLEIISEEAVNEMSPGISFLTAGTNMTGEGTCGAVSGSIMAIGIALLGSPRGSQDNNSTPNVAELNRKAILDRYYEKYRSILCKDVQRKRYGKAWDLESEEMTREFLSLAEGCAVMETAAWATECILTEFYKGNVRR